MLQHHPRVPSELVAFLADCHNRGEAEEAFASDPRRWHLALKTRLPFGNHEAIFLDAAAAGSLGEWLRSARAELRRTAPADQFAVLASIAARSASPPLPGAHLARLEGLLDEVGYASLVLPLATVPESDQP